MSFGTERNESGSVAQIDPRLYADWQQLNQAAQATAAAPYQAYGAPTRAGDNSFYTDARSTIQQAQGAGQALTGQAAHTYNDIANGSPMFINAPQVAQTTRADAAQVGDVLDVMPERAVAGAIPGASLSAYLNPYQAAVLDQSSAELERQRAMAQTQNAYSASRAGAFGGSRHGVVDSENNRNFAQLKQQNTNSLLQGGYDRATGLMTGDLDRAAQTSQFNTGQVNDAWTGNANRDLAAREADAMRRQQAGLAYAEADNSRNQFNALQALSALQGNQTAESETSRLNLQGAQGLLDTGKQQQALMLNQANALSGAGDQMKAAQDAIYGDQYQEFLRMIADPQNRLNILAQPFGLVPSNQLSTSSSSGKSVNGSVPLKPI